MIKRDALSRLHFFPPANLVLSKISEGLQFSVHRVVKNHKPNGTKTVYESVRLFGTFRFRCLPADIAIFGSCSDQAFECYDIIEGDKKVNTLKLQ